MSSIYSTDETLTAANSPYYIYLGVTINNGATLTIENGVEIIFMDDVSLYIDDTGAIDVGSGCNNTNNTIRGVLHPASYIHIHSNHYDRKGYISFAVYRDFSGSFCNTKFNSIRYISVGALPSSLLDFNFCEFADMQYALKADATQNYADEYHTISNSYLHDIDYATSKGYSIFDNCLIESFTNTGGITQEGSQIHLLNSHVIGTGNNTCFYHSLRAYVQYENSTIESCQYGIYMAGLASGPFIVTYTTIKDCDVAIYIGDDSYSTIKYNNFINNYINIQYYWRFTIPATKTEYYNFNYWGTSNVTLIASKIDDVCNRHSVGFVVWWPFYKEMIHITNNILPNNEDTIRDFGEIECNAVSTSNYLDFIYFADTILSVDGSPYVLINNVVINKDATLFIENGVEIHSNFGIQVFGELNIGCYELNTSVSSVIGLASDILSNHTIVSAAITFENMSAAHICNTLFNEIGVAHNQAYGEADIMNTVTFDHCEFSSAYSVTSYYDPYTTLYSNSYFHAFQYVTYAGQATYDRCVFRDFTKSIYQITIDQMHPPSIINSYIYGNISMNHTCLSSVNDYNWMTVDASKYGIKYNVFNTCLIGVEVDIPHEIIEGNTFENCGTAISINAGGNQTIKHNNFMNCDVAIANIADMDQFDCGYNYFDTTDIQQISEQIKDICDGFSNGLIYWWPYLVARYPSISASSIEYNGCKSLLNGSVVIYSPTSAPITDEPTLSPFTNSPSSSPITDEPTASPIYAPSTQTPSASPSNSPIADTPTSSPSVTKVTETTQVNESTTSESTTSETTHIIDNSADSSTTGSEATVANRSNIRSVKCVLIAVIFFMFSVINS